MDVRLKYVWEDVDRHGNVRIYIKVPGRKKVRIRQQPGTPEFMAAYNDAVEGVSRRRNRSSTAAVPSGLSAKSFSPAKNSRRLLRRATTS